MPAENVIDLKHLHSLTDGEPELEKNLFTLFLHTTEKCLSTLAAAAQEREDIAWRHALHELRGAASGLGANQIAFECKTAEMLQGRDADRRRESLKKIEKEVSVVRAYCSQKYA